MKVKEGGGESLKGNRKTLRERESKRERGKGVGRLKDCVCKHILKHTGKCELNINYFMLRNLGHYL